MPLYMMYRYGEFHGTSVPLWHAAIARAREPLTNMLRLSDMKDGPMYNAEATAHEGTVFNCNLHTCTRAAFLRLFCLKFHLGSIKCLYGQLQSCNLRFIKAQLRHACS